MSRRYGYARVSTTAQKMRMQMDALEAVGCDRIFVDHGVSGGKASRPGLDEALAVLRPGDELVVFKLCRLGRSVLHLSDLLVRFQNDQIHFKSISEGIDTTTPGGKLVFHIFAAMAEFTRDLIRENTLCGLEAAKARGKKMGRPYALSDLAVLIAHQMIVQNGVSVDEAAKRCGVAPVTLHRAFGRMDLAA